LSHEDPDPKAVGAMNVREAFTLRSRPVGEGISSRMPRGATSEAPPRHWGDPVVGGFFLSMGGVHLGLVAADVQTYRHFADAGLFAFVRDVWRDIFMAQPAIFGLLLMVGETA
jgi:hypothetical protein